MTTWESSSSSSSTLLPPRENLKCDKCFNYSCCCLETFCDFNLHRFSTASVEVRFNTSFHNEWSSRDEIFYFFHKIKSITSRQFPEFEFSKRANRKNSAKLVEEDSKKNLNSKKKPKDNMYNSCLIRKRFYEPIAKKEFNASCLIFKSSLIITLGNWEMREHVFKTFVGILRETVLQFTPVFEVTDVKTILANVSFKGNRGPRPGGGVSSINSSINSSSSSMSLTQKKKSHIPAKFVRLDGYRFDLAHTYGVIKHLFTNETRKIVFNPIVTDSNIIKIFLFKNDGKKDGTISIFSSGTIMFMGFNRMKSIVQEYKLISRALEKQKYQFKVQI